MIRKLPLKFTFLLLTFLINIPTIFAQVSLREISLKEQVDNSSLVAEGKVVAQRSFWDADHKLIYTANTVEVYKVFKGDVVETIEVLTVGGTVGLTALVSSHALKLHEGNIGVFTLHNNDVPIATVDITDKKQFRAYSGVQGFYEYDLDNNTVINKFSQRKGIQNTLYSDINNITKVNYKEVSAFDVLDEQRKFSQKNNSLPPASITFTPTTITAGTKSLLTINGTGFGATKGKVGFRDADDGGATFLDALDTEVLTWSDTQITVTVPSHAGNGTIRVTDASSGSNTSAASLTVSYAQINLPFNPGSGIESYQVQHYDDNASGGYTWEMQTDFFDDSEHPGAKASFMRAFDSWRCETKVNWEVSGTATTTDVIGVADLVAPFDGELDADGENVIRFDNGSELASGTLGTCYSWYSGRGCAAIVWWVADLDIVFDSGTNWYFGESGETFDSGEFDFETVALHELGHGHQLGHVINSSNVMHYALPPNFSNSVLDVNSIAGANDVQSRSTTNQICGTPIKGLMTDYAGTCGLSVEDNELDGGISLFPNPAKQQFFIKSAYLNLDKVEIYDISGRLVSDIDVSETARTKTINMHNASKGVYFVNIYSEGRFITKKLIIN
ncbi:hypothetical protein DIS18_03700 [Algibacter marinivivus]|uniref:Por secretion system C-terminal sorting domain-containing protein n=1 Tax=Algibacter marinivivus TaxID=2100723 RepID=A0A2U2X7E5_9FLAO|nr:T9SS type A sorting domain-containing protein [Algibacter marinivivus]PWH83670.1 hypothetical protein DIS18_03700 [Algibacter marinivivus]